MQIRQAQIQSKKVIVTLMKKIEAKKENSRPKQDVGLVDSMVEMKWNKDGEHCFC